MTNTADHRRDPLPLKTLAVCASVLVLAFSAHAWIVRALDAGLPAGAPFLFFGGLCVVAQFIEGIGAQALRRSRALRMDARESALAAIAMLLGTGYVSMSMHHALERAGFVASHAGFADQAMAWALSIGMPIAALCLWWLDEALRSRVKALCEAEDAAALAAAQAKQQPAARQASTPFPAEITDLELAQLTAEAREALITACASLMKRGINARKVAALRVAPEVAQS